jgi:hypothetical protein
MLVFEMSVASQSPPILAQSKREQAADAKACTVATLGTEKIVLCPPEGYISAREKDKALLRIGQLITPENMQLLAMFFPKQELQAFSAGKMADFPNYIIVMTLKSEEASYISTDSFQSAKQAYWSIATTDWLKSKDRLEMGMKQALARIAKDSASTLEASIQGSAGLGVTYETEQSISFGILAKKKMTVAGVTTSTLIACITTALLVKGKCCLINTYVQVKELEDIERAKLQAKEITDTTGKLNP